ncbi:hypothetical protein AHX64_20480 [Salmonella enterica subsp. enterica serovar Montevideo]|nr:hypothetical protein [Salmonella enterica]EBV4312676.1 hypothetical protein [Salmonella enterica subsp. enterica serovar Livingstone]EBZ6683745.1 hypothetical protein [Salmonella enterica subsp. enterica serovar Mbandaka]ECZ5462237.1 hypothetical protein [Salmonella enterica subsp. enterica serovar Montevideo]EDW2698438.1 hypothetical protein [Salmonella enterica subsp. enterica serovar Ohio]
MAKDGKHVIHAGGVFPNPLLNREGGAAAALPPGTVGTFVSGKFTAATAVTTGAIMYVADFDYLRCKTVDDSFAANDLVVAIQPLPGMFLNVRAAAGTYSKGQALTVGASGQVKAATTTGDTPDAVFAYCEEDSALTAAAGDLVRVVFK